VGRVIQHGNETGELWITEDAVVQHLIAYGIQGPPITLMYLRSGRSAELNTKALGRLASDGALTSIAWLRLGGGQSRPAGRCGQGGRKAG
jgi:hypothetical protein